MFLAGKQLRGTDGSAFVVFGDEMHGFSLVFVPVLSPGHPGASRLS